MHFRGLDLNLLVALDALITEKSISRTGEKINLSQPATSGALARLRDFFKDDLLVPVGRKMVLTPLAEELGQPVRQLLMQAEAIINRSPHFSPETSQRTFRLVMPDYVATVLMSRALPEIQHRAPGIAVEVLVPSIHSDRLDRGEADLMIVPKQYLAKDHPSEPLFADEFVCVAWTGNQELRGRTISMRNYLRLGHVVVRFGEQQQVPAFEEKFMEHFQRVPPHRSGHHRLHAGSAASRGHYAYCNSPPPARATLREAVAAEDSETAYRDTASGRIDAVALDSRRRPRSPVAPPNFTRGLCRTPDQLRLFSGRLLEALIHGRHEHLGGPWAAVCAVTSVVVGGNLSRLHLLERRATRD